MLLRKSRMMLELILRTTRLCKLLVSMSLSRQDIQILVGFGCPNADKKVVFSVKLLRKCVHLDEGDFEEFLRERIPSDEQRG
ncbi:hypothetical protein V6Z11_D05G052600 [Gossypium hirsutum]